MRTSLSSALVAATAAALLLPATAAFAGADTVTDSKKDTYEIGYDMEAGKETVKASAQDVNVDLKKAIVKHSAKRVELTGKYHSLSKKGVDVISIGSELKTADGGWVMYANAVKDGKKWTVGGYVYSDSGPAMGRGTIGCEDVKAHIDFAADTFTVSAPRSCLGSPKWVKAHVESSAAKQKNDGEWVNWFDNAHTKKSHHDGWTKKIQKG